VKSCVELRDLVIETPRLLLRPLQRQDFEAWAAMMADEETTWFLGGVQDRSIAWRSFMCVAGAWHLEGFAMFSVVEKSTGRWIGRVGPWRPEGWPGTEVGWTICRDRWGRGYATEAATAAIDWAFAELGWTDVIHAIPPDNVMSQGVARRLGSVNRGPTRMPPPHTNVPVDVWGQTRAEWVSRRPPARQERV